MLTTQLPASGTLTTVGAIGREFARAVFDIAGNRNGHAFAAFATGAVAPFTLYKVNLASGATQLPRGLTTDIARIGRANGPALGEITIRP